MTASAGCLSLCWASQAIALVRIRTQIDAVRFPVSFDHGPFHRTTQCGRPCHSIFSRMALKQHSATCRQSLVTGWCGSCSS